MSTKYRWNKEGGTHYYLRASRGRQGCVIFPLTRGVGWIWEVDYQDSYVRGLNWGRGETEEEAMKRVEEYMDLVDEY